VFEMTRRKLIFFASADPVSNPDPAWEAYHFAGVAAEAGLEAEVRLAGDAVKVALPDGVAASARGLELMEKVLKGRGAPFLVSL
jgi:hypothetical protein